jgi:quercetin dioxygenase-like cupin family protein
MRMKCTTWFAAAPASRPTKEDREVSVGSVIFVAAEVEHRFHDITEELAVLVFFAPAES